VFAVKPVVTLISGTSEYKIWTLARPNAFGVTLYLVRFADGRGGWNAETLVAAIFTMFCFGLFKLFHRLFGPQLFDKMALRPTTLFYRRKLLDPLGTRLHVGLGHAVSLGLGIHWN